jgi:hypothetical protein
MGPSRRDGLQAPPTSSEPSMVGWALLSVIAQRLRPHAGPQNVLRGIMEGFRQRCVLMCRVRAVQVSQDNGMGAAPCAPAVHAQATSSSQQRKEKQNGVAAARQVS